MVADASVLAQWVLPDEETCPGAEKLMEDVRDGRVTLLEPPLLKHELLNSIAVAVRRRRIRQEDALLAAQAFYDIRMLFSNPWRHGPSLLGLCLLPGVSAYDASYVTLAENHRCIFYTADKRLVAATRLHSDRVRLISEYGEPV